MCKMKKMQLKLARRPDPPEPPKPLKIWRLRLEQSTSEAASNQNPNEMKLDNGSLEPKVCKTNSSVPGEDELPSVPKRKKTRRSTERTKSMAQEKRDEAAQLKARQLIAEDTESQTNQLLVDLDEIADGFPNFDDSDFEGTDSFLSEEDGGFEEEE